MITALLIFSCGLVDRLRGDSLGFSKSIESFIYGLFVSAILGFDLLTSGAFSLLWVVGASFGWGTPIGAMLTDKPMSQNDLEWWQFWIFKERVVFACALRGVMWGACVLPVVYFDMRVSAFVFAMGLIFPTAISLAKRTKFFVADDWMAQEYYRGWMVGLIAFVIGYF